MAKRILSGATPVSELTPQYQLSHEARQQILAGSDSARQSKEIERKRLAFVAQHGSAFGQLPHDR